MNFINNLKEIKANIPAKNWTFLGVGGSPLYTYFPTNEEEIKYFLKNKPKELPYRTFGAGSNILIRDKDYQGIFIKLNKTFRNISINQNELIAEAGCPSSFFSNFCINNEIGGLEFISTIPGQIGGLTKMNAGITSIEMKDKVKWVEFIDETGKLHKLTNKECNFEYRKSIFKNNWIILRTAFEIMKSPKEEIIAKTFKLKQKRKETQPIIGKLAGCFFKNSKEKRAWELIKETKIKNFGGTEISNIHKNFIVANKSTNAAEIEYLIEIIRSKVLFSRKVFLESEIERIGPV